MQTVSLTVHLYGGVSELRVHKNDQGEVIDTEIQYSDARQIVNLSPEQIDAMPSFAWFKENFKGRMSHARVATLWSKMSYDQRIKAHAEDWLTILQGRKVEVDFLN